MAGLGEACTHVAAVLFYLEAYARIRGKQTCTQGECEWIIPSFKAKMEYLPIKDVDFTSAMGKKRKLDERIDVDSESQSHDAPQTRSRAAKKAVNLPSDEQMDAFYECLSACGRKPAILSLIPKYSDAYVPKASLPEFPQPLQLLYQPEYMDLQYHELLHMCETTEIVITADMAQAVEKATKTQYKSKLWFKYRAGRITASRLKAVCHTDARNPSKALVKSICYPEAFQFTSKQTAWGCKHEKAAKEAYEKKMKDTHTEFLVNDSGLVINPQWPCFGASPDGMVSCKCCGKGVLEIKCPYCYRNEAIEVAAADKKFCLKTNSDGLLCIDPEHSYYYQIQCQLFVCDLEYCDFCVCTFTSKEAPDLHIQRIKKDQEFWDTCKSTAMEFFKTCILPELLGKWYSRADSSSTASQVETPSTSTGDEAPKSYCYCKGPEVGKMIACDNPGCNVEWFHVKCLKIAVPKGKWYCSDCRKLPEYSRSRANKGKQKALSS